MDVKMQAKRIKKYLSQFFSRVAYDILYKIWYKNDFVQKIAKTYISLQKQLRRLPPWDGEPSGNV